MHYSFLRVAEALLRLVGWPKLVMLFFFFFFSFVVHQMIAKSTVCAAPWHC